MGFINLVDVVVNMIEEQLLNYGVLGLWTLTLLINQYHFNQKLIKALNDLEAIITKRL